jgi:hypothetical protein
VNTSTIAGAEQEGIRPGAPVDTGQYKQPSTSTTQPGQVRKSQEDSPTDTAAEGKSTRPGAPVDTQQYEQHRISAG